MPYKAPPAVLTAGNAATNIHGRLASVTWPLLVTVAAMMMLSVASISMLSSLRAYVNGEGRWSKAESRAIAELRQYSLEGGESHYLHFRSELAVPFGDEDARLQLQSADPDLERARAGLLAGGNDPSDVAGMIRVFRLFRYSSIMAPSIDYWRRADELMHRLAGLGEQIHAQRLSDRPDSRRIEQLLAEAEQVHLLASPLEDGYSASLGAASRRVANILSIVLAAGGFALVGIGIIVVRGHLRRGERMAAALRESQELVYLEQERAHVTLGSIADAVISIDPERRITYMNSAAERLTLWPYHEARQQPLGMVLRLEGKSGESSVLGRLESILAGQELSGPTSGITLQRRDESEVIIQERAAPIRDRHGKTIGIVLILRDITHERAMAARLEHQASHDPLTGLANRREFEAQLAAAIEDHRDHGVQYALLYLDLDQFKVINDTCGHAAGDALIRKISWLIADQLRGSDVLARLGGDEFGALLRDIRCEDALALADGIRRRIAELRFDWEDRLFAVNSSIGVIVIDNTMATVGDALSAADQACYLAKDSGRNRVQLYRPDDQQVRSRRGEMRWVERVNSALDTGSFVLVAQEIRPLSTSSQSGSGAPLHRYELLVRMVGADGAWVPPMAFIPAAERYGLMPRIDRWVIAEACRELASLRSQGHWLPVCMVNLSGASVSDPSLAEYIGGCLRQYSLPGAQVGFELTETAAIGNLASASQLMSRLRGRGSPIALDDFGSGMSSFSYLKTLPIDFLKIDGAFVRDVSTDPVDRAVVEAIQRIGHVMGIETIAESVEDEAALRTLTEIGVDHVQGFHVARPAPLSELTRIYRNDALPLRLAGR
jgi:diguanylate cyclase (GGDEF)-like protein/PAS domain S-box-containing protein